MYIIDKSRPTKLSSVLLTFLFLTVFTSPVAAEENYDNLPPDPAILFVTYESSEIIEMLNAKTMISEENPCIKPAIII